MRHAPGAAILAVAMMLGACTPLRSTPGTRYLGMLLNARDLGADALRIEMDRDPAIREYVARAGQPDFIVVGSPADVELIYVPPSRMVHFHRTPEGLSEVLEVTPIPTGLLQILPRDLRAGTPRPLNPGDRTACWTVALRAASCRTCCATLNSCLTECRQEGSMDTPRQKATYPRMSFAASFVSG